MFLRHPYCVLVGLVLTGCATVKDIPSPSKGSIDSPICSDGPGAQRVYLRKLRTEKGKPVRYKREDPIIGPNGHLFDPFVLRSGGDDWPFDRLFAPENAEDQDRTRWRIYMDMYRPGCIEKEAPPGFTLSSPE